MSGHHTFFERDELEPSVELDYEGNRRSHLPSPPASQASPSSKRTGLAVLRFVPETTMKEYPNGKRAAHFCCPMCDKVEDRKGNLEKHMARAHRIQAHILDPKESRVGLPKSTGRPRGRPPGSTKKNIAKAREAVEFAQRARHSSELLNGRRRKRKGKSLIDSPFRFGEMIDLTRSPSPPVVTGDLSGTGLRDSEQPITPEFLGRTFELHDQWQRQGVPPHAARVLNEALAAEQRNREKSLEMRAATNDKGKGRQAGNHNQEARAPTWRTAATTPPPISTSHSETAVETAETPAPAPLSSVDVGRAGSETAASQTLPERAPTPVPAQPLPTPAQEPVAQSNAPVCSHPDDGTFKTPERSLALVALKRKRSSSSPGRSELKDPNAETKYVAAGLREVSEDLAGAATCIIEYSQAMSQMLDGIKQFRRGAKKIGSDLQGMSALLNKLEVRFQDIASRFDAPEEEDEIA